MVVEFTVEHIRGTEMTTRTTQATKNTVGNAFANWDTIGKWGVYQIAFDAMKAGKIRLYEIVEIAEAEAGIRESVIRMRRADWIRM